MSRPFDHENLEVDGIVSVRIVADDVRKPAEPDRGANPFSVIVGAFGSNSGQMLLPHAPRRVRAVLTINGNAGDNAIIGTKNDINNGSNPVGAVVSPGMVLHITATSELWVNAKTGNSIVIGVIAEYKELH